MQQLCGWKDDWSWFIQLRLFHLSIEHLLHYRLYFGLPRLLYRLCVRHWCQQLLWMFRRKVQVWQ
jgi:hypothetical protein